MQISKENLDDISELVNIGMGKGAAMLNRLLESHIVLYAPVITFVSESELKQELNQYIGQELFAVQMGFSGDFNGDAKLIFSHEWAGKLVHALMGAGVETRLDDMDSVMAGMLTEVGNIVINSIIGTISNELNLSIKFSIPRCVQGNFKNIVGEYIAGAHDDILHACVHFVVAELKIEGDIIMFLGMESNRKLPKAIERYRIKL